MIIGCNLDVPGIAGIPQGSVVVMTDADWAGDVKDRRSYSGIAVWVERSVENTWYPVYASSKKQNMVCLSSGESELMALVGGACEGIATRDQWSKLCKCSPGTIVLCTDSSAALGFVKRKGASRRHVDTKVYFMQAWAMEPGQRILKVHGHSQQVVACLTKFRTPRAAHRKALGLLQDAAICRISMRRCGRSLPTKSLNLTDLNTFTNTFLISMRMKFVMTTTTKSDDELISLKETFGLCEGRAEQTFLHPRESNLIHVRTWLVNSALDSVESRMNCTDNNHVIGLWDMPLDASWYRVDSRLVTIDGMLLMFYQVFAFSSLVGR